jgi:hypothetical protein
MRGQRQAQAHVARDDRRALRRADDQVEVAERLDLKVHAGEAEGVAGPERGGELLLDLAERAAVAEAESRSSPNRR